MGAIKMVVARNEIHVHLHSYPADNYNVRSRYSSKSVTAGMRGFCHVCVLTL